MTAARLFAKSELAGDFEERQRLAEKAGFMAFIETVSEAGLTGFVVRPCDFSRELDSKLRSTCAVNWVAYAIPKLDEKPVVRFKHRILCCYNGCENRERWGYIVWKADDVEPNWRYHLYKQNSSESTDHVSMENFARQGVSKSIDKLCKKVDAWIEKERDWAKRKRHLDKQVAYLDFERTNGRAEAQKQLAADYGVLSKFVQDAKKCGITVEIPPLSTFEQSFGKSKEDDKPPAKRHKAQPQECDKNFHKYVDRLIPQARESVYHATSLAASSGCCVFQVNGAQCKGKVAQKAQFCCGCHEKIRLKLVK